MTSVLEVTVFDEDRDHKVEFLGRVVIPLLRIHNGEKRWYTLKDKTMFTRAKGTSPQVRAAFCSETIFLDAHILDEVNRVARWLFAERFRNMRTQIRTIISITPKFV